MAGHFSKNNWAGKFKRHIKAAVLPVSKNRRGHCLRCGECCKLPVRCPFLKYEDGKSRCITHDYLLPSCRKYPRTDFEHVTRTVCGFYFVE